MGVDTGGAGDQGLMFGFACRETPQLMPMPIMLAHGLTRRLAQARKSGEIAWLRPDGKSQVTVEYEGRTPVRVNTVVVSTQHARGRAAGGDPRARSSSRSSGRRSREPARRAHRLPRQSDRQLRDRRAAGRLPG